MRHCGPAKVADAAASTTQEDLPRLQRWVDFYAVVNAKEAAARAEARAKARGMGGKGRGSAGGGKAKG